MRTHVKNYASGSKSIHRRFAAAYIVLLFQHCLPVSAASETETSLNRPNSMGVPASTRGTANNESVKTATTDAHATSITPTRLAANATPFTATSSGSTRTAPVIRSNLVDRPKRELFSALPLGSIDSTTHEIAEQLEILPLLEELYATPHPNEQRKILLRQKIQETILESFFDAQSVAAEAEREQARIALIRETLVARRDRNVEINNAGNFIFSGALNTVGSALGFSKTANPFSGNLNQMMGGVVSTGMSTYALKQQAGGHTGGQGAPTILAELFGRPTDFRTAYPESVWRFLHGKAVDRPDKTRVQLLEERWIVRHYLEPHGSAREQLKIDAVCGKVGGRMTIDDLSDEISMIADVSGVTELMTHHLRDLLRMIDSDVSI